VGAWPRAGHSGSSLWTVKLAVELQKLGRDGRGFRARLGALAIGAKVSTATPCFVAAISGIEPSIFQYSNTPRGLDTRPLAWNSAT